MIRKATAQDFPYILDMYMKGLKETGETHIVESMCLRKIVNSFHLAPCFLLLKNDKIIGMAGLTTATSSHNGDATLYDYMFYVEPDNRTLDNLSCLVNSIKEFALEMALPVKLEFLAQDNPKIRERLFRMHGFKVHSIIGGYYG